MTSLAAELLKSSLIPFVKAELHPRLTAAAISVVATVIALLQSGVTVHYALSQPQIMVAVFGGILLVASSTYNQLLKNANLFPAAVAAGPASDPQPSDAIDQVQPDAPAAAPQPEAAPAADAPAPAEETYTVVAGDTIPKAAAKLGVSPESLAAANGLEVGSGLDIDQVLKVQR